MPPAIDNLVPDTGLAPASSNDVRATRAYAQKMFAELASRIFAFGIDLFLVLLLGAFVESELLGVNVGPYRRIVYDLLLLVYFAASWASPLQATPIQFLFRMRVFHQSGHPLTPAGAALRSLLVVALWEATTSAFKWVNVDNMHPVAAIVGVLVFFVAVTAHRQGIHDLLSQSVVINNRAIQSAEQKQAMYEFLAETDSEALNHRRPKITSMIANGVVLAGIVFLLVVMTQVTNDKNLRARVGYALTETRELQDAAAVFYTENAHWPITNEEAGVPLQRNYPDGGYYELQENGEIRIQFEVKPELVGGSIVLSPNMNSAEPAWNCRIEGDIDSRYTPHHCRE